MQLIVIGGGCYGCYHTRQLLKAHQRGKIAAQRFVVVDRNPACRALTEFAAEPLVEVVRSDWARFLHTYLRERAVTTDDRLVPAPFAPHLLFDWLLDAMQEDVPQHAVRRVHCELALDLPYEQSDEVGNRFISAAGWRCPASCIEPARCPAIRSERTWELGELVLAGAARAAIPYAHTALFTCRHYAYGVGTIPVRELVRARIELAAIVRQSQPAPLRALIGTVSACHGVLGELVAQPCSANSASTGR
jgi:hypothetical protein